MSVRKSYPSDVCDEEVALVAPYLVLLPEHAGQREHSLREAFNGLRYVHQDRRALALDAKRPDALGCRLSTGTALAAAGCFEALAEDLRTVLRQAAGRKAQPNAAILDSRTLRSSPESGERAGYDGAKRKKGTKLHLAVDTLGHLLALHITPASADNRAEVGPLAQVVPGVTHLDGERLGLRGAGDGAAVVVAQHHQRLGAQRWREGALGGAVEAVVVDQAVDGGHLTPARASGWPPRPRSQPPRPATMARGRLGWSAATTGLHASATGPAAPRRRS